MKYLLGLGIVLIIVWYWRTSRSTSRAKRQAPRPPSIMAVCAHCGVHLPAQEAIAGSHGAYCSISHRQLAEP